MALYIHILIILLFNNSIIDSVIRRRGNWMSGSLMK